jgi:hypothetical protein
MVRANRTVLTGASGAPARYRHTCRWYRAPAHFDPLLPDAARWAAHAPKARVRGRRTRFGRASRGSWRREKRDALALSSGGWSGGLWSRDAPERRDHGGPHASRSSRITKASTGMRNYGETQCRSRRYVGLANVDLISSTSRSPPTTGARAAGVRRRSSSDGFCRPPCTALRARRAAQKKQAVGPLARAWVPGAALAVTPQIFRPSGGRHLCRTPRRRVTGPYAHAVCGRGRAR